MTRGPEAAVRRHFRAFYDGPPDRRDDRPLLVVLGNCQAESLRLMMTADDVVSVRVPAVHVLEPHDVEPLHRLLDRADLLVAQPVADDYHALPLGTAQLARRLGPHARQVLVPSLRYAGLHPYHLVVHPPGLQAATPPLVAYHDLRTAVRAAWHAAGRSEPAWPEPTAAQVRAVGERSRGLLRDRQHRHGTVAVDDLLAAPTFADLRTVNHPGNPLLGRVAARLRRELGLPDRPPAVTRPLLDAVHAPRHPVVVTTCDPSAVPTDDWRVDGAEVDAATVAQAHLEHYRRHPAVLDAVLERGAPELEILGLHPPGRTA